MNEFDSDPKDFKTDYERLELNDRAGWDQARTNYRRLVHRWHPDKYALLPRERPFAQQQFILLTKSYDNLKAFQRDNGRLPFEPTKSTTSPETRTTVDAKQGSANGHIQEGYQGSALGQGVLGRDAGVPDHPADKPSSSRKLLWITAGLTLLLATITLFFVLDYNANKRMQEQAKEALRQAPKSEFMPSAAEIRKSESRGAFIQPPK